MANAHGGVVLLGVREKDGEFSIAGLSNAAKLRTELFNNLNNPAKVSANLLSDAGVEELAVDGKTILAIRIPQATRKQKPVFLHGQPLGNTYRRLNDGGRKCDDETVKRMLAEQMEDSRDTPILDKFGMRDLDADSLRAYRNAFAVHRPGHPWLNAGDDEFLRLIGGWREDRASGEAGLTAAGLLMFGQWTSIAEAFSLYFLDYQERPADAQSQTRWLKMNWASTVSPVAQKTSEKTPDLIVAQLRHDPTLTIAQLSVALKRSNRAIERALVKLREQGVIQRIGPDKGGRWEVLS